MPILLLNRNSDNSKLVFSREGLSKILAMTGGRCPAWLRCAEVFEPSRRTYAFDVAYLPDTPWRVFGLRRDDIEEAYEMGFRDGYPLFELTDYAPSEAVAFSFDPNTGEIHLGEFGTWRVQWPEIEILGEKFLG